ncbi:MAG: zinc ribbon domain-containing protein [Bacillota bacterium]|jgi:putative FmdB family regulatory protein
MPIYEFRCLKCGELFEKLFVSAGAKVELSCPKCQSDMLERVISATNYAMGSAKGGSKPTVTTKSCSSGNKCSTLEIPGPE